MIERRSPHQVGKEIAKGINNGNIKFFDKHLSMFPVDLMYGFYTKEKKNNRLDVAIVEASAITEDGGIIPGASVGASPEIIQMADKIIIEVCFYKRRPMRLEIGHALSRPFLRMLLLLTP